MKRILTSFAIVAASLTFAQVSVSGDDNHTPEATLDVKAIGGTNTADGILIPRVDRNAAQIMSNVKESTLIYINSVSNGTQSGQAADIDTKGFYYFKDGKWVKLGGEASSSNTSINLVNAKGNIRSLPLPVDEGEFKNDDFAVLVTGPAEDEDRIVNLPSPGNSNDKNGQPRDFTNRFLSINNQGGGIITFKGSHVPVNMTRLNGGAGFLLMSDGTNWYVIAGLF